MALDVAKVGVGDMTKIVYDPNDDGDIAYSEIENSYIAGSAFDTAVSGDVLSIYSGSVIRSGQKITGITNEAIKVVRFMIQRAGSPTGDVSAVIRKVSDDSIIDSVVFVDAGSIPTATKGSYSPTFPGLVEINEDIRVCMEYSGGDAGNYLKHWHAAPPDRGIPGTRSHYTAAWTDDAGGEGINRLQYADKLWKQRYI